jgi:hypothetical protein
MTRNLAPSDVELNVGHLADFMHMCGGIVPPALLGDVLGGMLADAEERRNLRLAATLRGMMDLFERDWNRADGGAS